MSTIEIRDARAGDRYFIDNALLRSGLGARIGPYGIAVYNALALHAHGSTQDCWPSYATIAEMTGMSRRHVISKIAQLQELGLVAKETRVAEDGLQQSNVYVLLDKSSWADQGGAHHSPGVVHTIHRGGEQGAPEQYPLEQDPEEQADVVVDDARAESEPATADEDPVMRVVRLYEQEIGGMITPMILQDIEDLVETETSDLERWRAAFQASIGARNRWKYAKAIILHPERKPPQEVKHGQPYQRRRAAGAGQGPSGADLERYEREAAERLRRAAEECPELATG